MTSAHLLPLAVLAALGGLFVAWPFFGGRAAARHAARAQDHHRQELEEEKAAIYRALHELGFDHEAGHLSEDDYREMRERYERRAAEVLRELDALGPTATAPRVTPTAEAGPAPAPRPRPSEALAPAAAPAAATVWTRSPMAIAVGAMLMVVFGVILGIGVGRFSQPEAPSMPGGATMPPGPAGPGPGMPAAPAAAGLETPGAAAPGGAMGGAPGQPLPPQVLTGMLQAARQMLFQGQYQEAISAYQAVLKRDPNNVDAMTHLALIVAIGGHGDSALETWDKALKIDPKYAPAYLYRGQVLYETKQDYAGAIKAWERFVALVSNGEDRDRAQALIKDARAKQTGR